MGFFSGTKKLDDKSPEADVSVGAIHGPVSAPVSLTRVTGSVPDKAPARRFGIDQTIQLMRSLPTGKNVDLVITVLTTTLESLEIRVVDIVHDATRRQHEIEERVAGLKSEIAALENEVDHRVKEIMRLEAAHSETTLVKNYLEQGTLAAKDVGERATTTNDDHDGNGNNDNDSDGHAVGEAP